MRSEAIEYRHFIEIVPVDEEDMHISGFDCECCPQVTIPHPDAKPVIKHNTQPVYREARKAA